MPMPFEETVVKTSPIIPKGARFIIQRTTLESASAKSLSICFVPSPAMDFSARPKIHAHTRMPM